MFIHVKVGKAPIHILMFIKVFIWSAYMQRRLLHFIRMTELSCFPMFPQINE